MENSFLEFGPIQKFTKGVGDKVREYFGKERGCVIALGDDGFFYGQGLYQWLLKQGVKVDIVFMDDEGRGLEEEKIKGKKLLVVDNDIVTGSGYKRTMELLRSRREELKIKEIKFAALCDRVGLADFSVEDYSGHATWSLKELDGLDLKIIKFLSKNGRESFVRIAKDTKLSPVGVKNRVEKMLQRGILKIKGALSLGKFYTASAQVNIEADQETVTLLIEKFEKSPLVYHLVKTSGRFNLVVGLAAANLITIEDFIAKEIRANPGVRHLEVNVGALPIIPCTWHPPIS